MARGVQGGIGVARLAVFVGVGTRVDQHGNKTIIPRLLLRAFITLTKINHKTHSTCHYRCAIIHIKLHDSAQFNARLPRLRCNNHQ